MFIFVFHEFSISMHDGFFWGGSVHKSIWSSVQESHMQKTYAMLNFLADSDSFPSHDL